MKYKLVLLYLMGKISLILLAGCTSTAKSSEAPSNLPPLSSGTLAPKLIDVSHIKNKHLDVSYAGLSDAQKLDIYLPDTYSGKLPVIVSVHGGAFKAGDKRDGQVKPMLEGLKRGYAIISINYRLSKEAKFPANILDVKTALRWIRANADKYSLDADKIVIWGGSAGGNLASLAGTAGDEKEFDDETGGNLQYSSRVQAVVNWFGPTDFLKMDEQLRASGDGNPNHSEANSPESLVLGAKLADVPDLVKKANPETYISADDPPFFIQHNRQDPLIPKEQSINFYEKLKKQLGADKVTITLFENKGHGGPQFESPENLLLVFEFLDKSLKK